MKFLGHQSIKNTLIYIDLERLCYPNGGEDYIGKGSKDASRKTAIGRSWFRVSADPDGTQCFKKRKWMTEEFTTRKKACSKFYYLGVLSKDGAVLSISCVLSSLSFFVKVFKKFRKKEDDTFT